MQKNGMEKESEAYVNEWKKMNEKKWMTYNLQIILVSALDISFCLENMG
jgi:hypothetical protein